jgi:hypothetical protein
VERLFGDELSALIEARGFEGLSGIASARGASPDTVWWKDGAVPDEVLAFCEDWPSPVLVFSSPFSENEVNGVVARIARDVTQYPFRIKSIGPDLGAAGIHIGVAPADLGIVRRYLEEHDVSRTTTNSIPVTVVVDTSNPVLF